MIAPEQLFRSVPPLSASVVGGNNAKSPRALAVEHDDSSAAASPRKGSALEKVGGFPALILAMGGAVAALLGATRVRWRSRFHDTSMTLP
mmetsp:Transcript_18241/g.41796  ORF Transcript_18241/g.41796 Transcript_18241/m.41796 type:complete len:90 (+) Transcript_18241:2920-3189(+)